MWAIYSKFKSTILVMELIAPVPFMMQNRPWRMPKKGAGERNHYSITFKGDKIIVYLNGVKVQDWKVEPRGKIKNFADKGYIGLQNHDWETAVFYRNIFLKELD